MSVICTMPHDTLPWADLSPLRLRVSKITKDKEAVGGWQLAVGTAHCYQESRPWAASLRVYEHNYFKPSNARRPIRQRIRRNLPWVL